VQIRTENIKKRSRHSPDAFVYHIMQEPEYMTLLAGKIIHIVKCVPVEIKLASTQECYDQLSVIRNNETISNTTNSHPDATRNTSDL